MKDYFNFYASFLKRFLKIRRPMRVVFDCSNGATALVIKKLRNYVIGKLEVILINDKIDGNFPAHGPNPMERGAMSDLRLAVRKHKADLGVIFDGDGDRVFFADNAGRPVAADIVIAFIGKNYKGPAIVDTRIGYLGRELLKKAGKKIFDSRVGHYFIKILMKQKKVNFSGELSVHYYFHFAKDDYYADSGIFAAIQFINAVSRLGSGLAEWIDAFPRYYNSGELNFRVRDKQKITRRVERVYENQARKISHLDGLKMEFDDWWFNLRPSNTENLLRLNLEAKDKDVFRQRLPEIKRLLLG